MNVDSYLATFQFAVFGAQALEIPLVNAQACVVSVQNSGTVPAGINIATILGGNLSLNWLNNFALPVATTLVIATSRDNMNNGLANYPPAVGALATFFPMGTSLHITSTSGAAGALLAVFVDLWVDLA